MNPRKSMTLVFLILLLGIGYVSMDAAPVLSDEEYSYHGDTAWRTNFSDARQVAAEQDKPVVVYFWTTWCTYCEDYNRKVYPDPDVQSHLDDFVKVAVNLDSDAPEASQLKRQYNADYPPQHVIVTPDGEELVRISGYADRDSFIQYLETAKQRADSGETR
ncbi:thioredoxin family protein [Halorussus salinisoli]|uniref:thioredoxin family protein n=1 Tax=Halorussus salinisoli TaxID=2558242 RepID=UPI0014852000|nr:thioredoxin family protein [Halorussus salinisoli]